MGKVVGIDLGTTNSVAAFKFANIEVVIADGNAPPDRQLTRSMVAVNQGALVVGEMAYNQIGSDPENVIVSIKRLMGRGFNDPTLQDQQSRFSYKITAAEHGTENSLSVFLAGKAYEPEDISAEILKQVVRNADDYQAQQGQKNQITSAVITVPAYFNDKQRHATREAASRAGIIPLELLPEPTAAAISYGFKPDGTDAKTILVYDFGGGTFDASIIATTGNQFIELGKAGDLWLGGDDVDHLLVQHVKQLIAQEEELDNVDALIAKMPHYQRIRFNSDLRKAVERAKIDLSRAEVARVIPATPLLDDMGLAIPVNVEITRQAFEQLLTPLVDRTIEVCHSAIRFSEYTIDLIDAVLLVGGSSQIPLVQRKVQVAFGTHKVKVAVHPRPMTAVAEGAAIVAAGLIEKVGTVSRDYFIELVGGDPQFKIIAQGDVLPIKTAHTFKTIADGQRLIHFKFSNYDEVHQRSEPVGQMWLGLDKYYPKGTEVLVALELDEQIGDLCITAVLKNDPAIRVSSSFSRGKADEKIYDELVQVIADINQRGLNPQYMEEVSQQIVPIVFTTNQILDPKTGREKADIRRRAERELTELKVSFSEERNDAKFFVDTFDFLLKTCDFLIEPSQKNRLQLLREKLQSALDRNDLSAIDAYTEDANREMKNLPDLVQIVYMCRLAISQAHSQNPTQARAMAEKLARMLSAMERGDGTEGERLWRELQPDILHWIDQDLPTASIATGISR
ncbi:Hsp70 family protein [Prochlorothrix hollandica]|uniref:Molecular chaperone Hsp70 n=1 Tax=Prochlorothrix hollandica PCC 9006 = CALU 1027 TaxID=317619 RepID=A0A0M2PUL0_PROHO|nr:Hsp70 family protein [Prochlorothrix hollandica]KKI98051.1 molecular chaperone Hsp70 [Prochlorothrix hollandica PCC 9006 = CALU 1027]